VLEDCAYSWGFRVKENQKDSKRAQVLIEEETKVVVSGLNISLKTGDLMVVVGQVGCGKTTILHSIMEETKLCSGK
jgi:ABC-type cobalamin/Fe3+-siderophores transport system ATPase subunit